MTKFLCVFSLLFIVSSSIKAQNSKQVHIADAEAKQWYDTLIMPSVVKVQSLLDTETAFISYFLGEKFIYVHFLTDKTADLYLVPINTKFPDLIKKFRNAIINQSAKEYSKLGFQLYKKLFPMTISKNINNLVIDKH